MHIKAIRYTILVMIIYALIISVTAVSLPYEEVKDMQDLEYSAVPFYVPYGSVVQMRVEAERGTVNVFLMENENFEKYKNGEEFWYMSDYSKKDTMGIQTSIKATGNYWLVVDCRGISKKPVVHISLKETVVTKVPGTEVPGFNTIFAIGCLLIVLCMVMKRRR